MPGIEDIIRTAFNVLFFIIIARVILSWIPMGNPNNPIIIFIHEITEPILAPIRKLIPLSLPIDLSPIVAIILIRFVEWFILGLIR